MSGGSVLLGLWGAGRESNAAHGRRLRTRGDPLTPRGSAKELRRSDREVKGFSRGACRFSCARTVSHGPRSTCALVFICAERSFSGIVRVCLLPTSIRRAHTSHPDAFTASPDGSTSSAARSRKKRISSGSEHPRFRPRTRNVSRETSIHSDREDRWVTTMRISSDLWEWSVSVHGGRAVTRSPRSTSGEPP